jgi:hypothetical protein
MKFLVVEKVHVGTGPAGGSDITSAALEDLKYKVNLEKKGKIIGGGPFLDTIGDSYILQTKTIEEMGEILFNSPTNFMVEREVHPLGTFADSFEGMKELNRRRK